MTALFAPTIVAALPLAAMILGMLTFTVSFLAIRASRDVASTGQRSLLSVAGILLQGAGVGLAGMGALTVGAKPLDATAVGETVLVALLMAAAVSLFTVSARTLGRNWSLVARTRSDHELVTGGPFAYVRHPIYLAMLFFLIAFAATTRHWSNLLVALPLFAAGTAIRDRKEEKLLRTAFGGDYDAYAARVPRFVPGFF